MECVVSFLEIFASDTLVDKSDTMIVNSDTSNTMIVNVDSASIINDLGTMIINDTDDDSTMRSTYAFRYRFCRGNYRKRRAIILC